MVKTLVLFPFPIKMKISLGFGMWFVHGVEKMNISTKSSHQEFV